MAPWNGPNNYGLKRWRNRDRSSNILDRMGSQSAAIMLATALDRQQCHMQLQARRSLWRDVYARVSSAVNNRLRAFLRVIESHS